MDMLGALILPPKLSTPSFGITNLSQIYDDQGKRSDFQLPLSGSRDERGDERVGHQEAGLSTPSLGITRTYFRSTVAVRPTFFQLPLSGSHGGREESRLQKKLSTPSLGITAGVSFEC